MMPKRNLVTLFVVPLLCLVAWAARDRGVHGRRFGEVLAKIERGYLEPVDDAALFHRAMDGVFAGLDEHSAYLSGTEIDDLDADLGQQFGGVGLQLAADPRDRTIVVDDVLAGSPAWREGIRPGERIVAVDGEAAAGRPLREVVARLRGRPQTRVNVDLAPPRDDPAAMTADDGQPVPVRTATLARELLRSETVRGDRRRDDGGWEWRLEGDERVALVRIASFGEGTVAELDAALDAIAAGSPPLAGLVVDLRGNGGGLLSTAIEVCDRFLDRGVIVSTRSRPAGPRQAASPDNVDVRRATAGERLAGVPVAVLVDGMTASAGEIVAACLQDNARSITVGSRTFGKGTVQSLLPLGDGSSMIKLTTAEYLRPNGTTIHRRPHHRDDDVWGVSPDPAGAITPTGEVQHELQSWRRGRDRVPAGAASSPPAADPALSMPRHADPVLGRALALLDGDARLGTASAGTADRSGQLPSNSARTSAAR